MGSLRPTQDGKLTTQGSSLAGSLRRAQDDKLATQGNLLVGSFRPTQDGKLTTQGSSLAGSFRRAQDGRSSSSGVVLLLVRYGVGGFVCRQGLSMYLSCGGDCCVEIGGALLVGSLVKGLSFVHSVLSLILPDGQRCCS